MTNDTGKNGNETPSGPESSRFQTRLNEMSASIEALARKAGELQNDARARLHATVDDLRSEQERLQGELRDAQSRGTRAWSESRADFEQAWDRTEQRISETAREFGAEREAAMARAGALLRTWQETAAAYAQRTAKTFREGRGDMDRIFDDLRARQREVQAELNNLGRSGVGAWGRMTKGFEGAWRELDSAFRSAVGEFERATGAGKATPKRRSARSGSAKAPGAKSSGAKSSAAKTSTAKKTGAKATTTRKSTPKAATAKGASSRTTSAKSSSAKSSSAKAGAAKSSATKTARTSSAKRAASTAKTSTTRSASAKSGTAKSGTAKSGTKPAGTKSGGSKSGSSKSPASKSGAGTKPAARKASPRKPRSRPSR